MNRNHRFGTVCWTCPNPFKNEIEGSLLWWWNEFSYYASIYNMDVKNLHSTIGQLLLLHIWSYKYPRLDRFFTLCILCNFEKCIETEGNFLVALLVEGLEKAFHLQHSQDAQFWRHKVGDIWLQDIWTS